MSGNLIVEKVSEGRYRLTLIVDVELSSGFPRPETATFPNPSVSDTRDQLDRRQLALTVKQVSEELHIGRDHVYHLLRTGELESIKIGKLRRIPTASLRAYINRLLDEGSRPQTS